jgi:hypothetical protein
VIEEVTKVKQIKVKIEDEIPGITVQEFLELNLEKVYFINIGFKSPSLALCSNNLYLKGYLVLALLKLIPYYGKRILNKKIYLSYWESPDKKHRFFDLAYGNPRIVSYYQRKPFAWCIEQVLDLSYEIDNTKKINCICSLFISLWRHFIDQKKLASLLRFNL